MKKRKMQPEQTGFSLLYVTCPDKDVAEQLARLALDKKLAACANIISGMTAIYPWKGKIAQENEVILLLKTRKNLVAEAMKAIGRQHPYEIPAILEIPLGELAETYRKWLLEETT